MNDTKTLIRSSIISLIIVVIGLFTLCISRAPKLNVEQPFIEGSGLEDSSDESELSDDEFLSLLESADDDAWESDDAESDVESLLLEDDSQSTEAGSQKSEDEELAELFELLEIEDENASESDSDFLEEDAGDDELQQLLAEADSETEESSDGVSAEAITSLEAEITELEQVLESKDAEINNIQQSINEYDNQIAQLESGQVQPGGTSGAGVQYASRMQDTQSSTAFESSEFGSASSFEGQYDIALSYYNNRQYQSAILAFEKLLQGNNTHPLADNCQYWIAESQFARGNYYQAIVDFEKVFSFDAADKKDDAQIMIGIAYLKAGIVNQARNDFSWFLACYQSSEYIPRAVRYMEEL